MEKVFTMRELEVLNQFFKDGDIGKSNKKFILDQEIADRTEALINKYQTKNFTKDNIVISVEFSANGGTFQLMKLSEIEKDDNGLLDFDIKENIYKELHGKEIGFMIEPFDYSHIEPYNRQQPYYFPYSYSNLDKKTFSEFNLYLLKKNDWNSNVFKRLDKYHYNYVWHTINFDVLLEEKALDNFMIEFFTLYNMGEMLNSILDYIQF
jgi:hypothetical protein